MKQSFGNVDAYIRSFPADVQSIMQQIRNIIVGADTEVQESISYGMPAYKTYGKPLVYFAGYKNHIGLYALPTGHAAFADALQQFKQGKGSVQFRLDSAIPYDLIKKIVTFRIEENKSKYALQ